MTDFSKIAELKQKLIEASVEVPFAATDSLVWFKQHEAVAKFAKECLKLLEPEEKKENENSPV